MTKAIFFYIIDLIKWLSAILAGFIVYPIFPKDMNYQTSRGYGRFKNKTIDKIWGNEIDGLSGDEPYRNNQAKKWYRKLWPSFWWSCIRNPANNLARHIRYEGSITEKTTKGNLTIYTLNTGDKVFFFFTPNNLLMWKIGYKLWPDSAKVGDYVIPELAFSLQRGKK